MLQSETGISARLDFMKFDQSARERLRGLQPLLKAHMNDALTAFYDRVRATPEIGTLFKGEKHIDSAQQRQHMHWDRLAAASFDADYEKAVLTVGRTHARIGLEPRWYIGGYALIADHLIKTIINDRESTLLKRLTHDPAELGDMLGAFIKAIFLDMDLAISIYLQTLAEERRRSEEARAEDAQRQTEALEALTLALTRLARGDLTARLNDEVAPEFSRLRSDFNATIEKLQDVIGAVLGSMRSIENGNRELAQASDDLARRTEQQAASLEETTAALTQITQGVRATTDGVAHARNVAETATRDAAHASEIVSRSKSAMNDIQRATAQIGQITDVIDEIAFQTNLLALNAGVEAARAGESGRGFAVVASEVRSLAQRASQSAKDIKSLIDHATTTVAEGAALVSNTEGALDRFVGQVREITTIIGNIADTAREQTTGLNEVNLAVNDLDRTTQQNAAMVEQSTAATQSLAEEATRLSRQLDFFTAGESKQAKILPLREPQRQKKPNLPLLQNREKQIVNARIQPTSSKDEGWIEF